MGKKIISLLLCVILLVTNFSTVFAEEITEEKNSKFELMLLDKYEQNRDYLLDTKNEVGDLYTNKFQCELEKGTEVFLKIKSKDDTSLEYQLIEWIDEKENVLYDGVNSEFDIDTNAVGIHAYEVRIINHTEVIECKKIQIVVDEKEDKNTQIADSDTERTINSDSQEQAIADDTEEYSSPLSVNLINNKTNREYVNRAITLTANAYGGTGALQYEFSDVYQDKTIILQKYSKNNTYSFNTTKIGVHKYYVTVKDDVGNIVKQSYQLEVVAHPNYRLEANVISNKTQQEYEYRSVCLTANVKNGYGNYQYEFLETYNGETTVVKKMSSSNTYSFMTKNIGQHIYTLNVTDGAGQKASITYSMNVYREPDKTLDGSISSNKSTREYVDRKIVLTAKAIGGNGPFSYQFSEEINGKKSILQGYSEKGTYSFITSTIGRKNYYVDIKDNRGKIVTKKYTMDVVPHPDYLLSANLESDKTSQEYENRWITLTAKVDKGYGEYQYEFLEEYNGKTKTVKNIGSENKYKFLTSGVGRHIFKVNITDKSGQKCSLQYILNVYTEPLVSMSGVLQSNKTEREYVDRSIVLTANVRGGNGTKQYCFIEEYEGKKSVVQDYSSKNTYSFMTKKIGVHKFYVNVKDSRNQILSLMYSVEVVVHPNLRIGGKIVNNKTTDEYENRSVILTAEMTNGYGNYQYEFYDTYNGSTSVVRAIGTSNEYHFTTKGIGKHQYKVKVVDRAGQTCELSYSINVYTEPNKEMSCVVNSSKTENEYVNRSVTLTANAQGGSGIYQYQFSEQYDGKTVVVQAYSSKKTYSFTTKQIGAHKYIIDVKDSNGKSVQTSYTMKVSAQAGYELSVTLKSNKTEREYVNRQITLTANVTGGYDSNYQYRFSEIVGNNTYVRQKFSEKNIYTFTTDQVGEHVYYVTVQDGQNQSARATYKMTVVIEPEQTMNVSLSSNKTSYEYSNRSVRLIANVSGGYGDYQYQFVRVSEGNSKVVRGYSSSSMYSFSTGLPGKYIYYVNVKDKYGSVAQASYAMTIVSDGNIFKGIDVSSYQGTINWKKVKDDGVTFAMLRVVNNKMSALSVDPYFYQNAKSATSNGIAIGAYRYGYAVNVTEAKQEAEAVVNALKKSGCTFACPIAYDMEDEATQGKLTIQERTEILKTFRDIIESNGYKFMIYASKSWLEDKIDMNSFAAEDVWIARYRDNTPDLGHGYTGKGNITIWQYSDKGKVSGIGGNVDMNIGYIKY